MKLKLTVLVLTLSSGLAFGQFGLDQIKKKKDDIKTKTEEISKGGGTSALSESEVIEGLKEALSVGSKNAASFASKVDGFNGNSLIKIPFPEDAQKMESQLRKVGFGKQCDEFIHTLNEAAELASKEVGSIFLDAIKGMDVKDGMKILKGEDDAATEYLRTSTNQQLYDLFKPVITKALKQVNITKYWTPLAERYNKIPFTEKVDPDLEDYTTKQAIVGMFKLLAVEELKIRKDINSRVTDILKKVFGELDAKKEEE